ncbi:copper-binding protein [Fulvimarina sp. MAC3]|uniref:copper-binding protein n=1 Tax=Fulvimarina sp. MAC3 TaxID=3148887 RepID=UPI0031FC0283
MRIITLALSATLFTAPAFADNHMTHEGMNHGSMTMDGMNDGSMNHSSMDHGAMKHSDMEGIHTTATINRIDGDTINVSHPAIPALRWPPMTMDMTLLDGAEVGEISEGDQAMLMLEQGKDGMVGIRAVMPAE